MLHTCKFGYVDTELMAQELRSLIGNQKFGGSIVFGPTWSKGFFHGVRLFVLYGFALLVPCPPTYHIQEMLLPAKLIEVKEIRTDYLIE